MTFWKAVYVHVCAHAYYVCLHLSKQIGFLKKPHRMTECSLVLSPNSSPCPIFLSSPSLSLFFCPQSLPSHNCFLKLTLEVFFLLPLFDFTYSVFGLALGCWSSANAEKWQHWWPVQLDFPPWFQSTSSDWSSRFWPAFSGWFSCWFSLPKLTSGRLVFLSCGCFVVSKSI